MLLHVCLSRGELDEARSALQEFERLGTSMNQHYYLYLRSHFTTVDQVRLWLACGELDQATVWLEQLDLGERHGTLFAREREEVACGRVLLAQNQPALALRRLEPVLKRATTDQRWGHVIEIQLLQALAYQMCNEEKQALSALSEAVRLSEPEGYIRSLVDEGRLMKALLCRLTPTGANPVSRHPAGGLSAGEESIAYVGMRVQGRRSRLSLCPSFRLDNVHHVR